jgi:hypothetical protein
MGLLLPSLFAAQARSALSQGVTGLPGQQDAPGMVVQSDRRSRMAMGWGSGAGPERDEPVMVA